MTVIREPDEDGGSGIWCDPCMEPLVRALNTNGLSTVASCCGHGTNYSSVALADGRWVIVLDDHETFERFGTQKYKEN